MIDNAYDVFSWFFQLGTIVLVISIFPIAIILMYIVILNILDPGPDLSDGIGELICGKRAVLETKLTVAETQSTVKFNESPRFLRLQAIAKTHGIDLSIQPTQNPDIMQIKRLYQTKNTVDAEGYVGPQVRS